MNGLSPLALALYALPLSVLIAFYVLRRRRRESSAVRELEVAVASGLAEPVSLHPIVDPVRCIGSSTCLTACPEDALGIIKGKAQLVNPSVCIGHGACAAACPLDAITLVFGSERRGIDIPIVTPDFETNIRGIYIAGELGGMGLIRKAAEQGRQAIRSIAKRPKTNLALDVVIVGAGPAGLTAGLGAVENKLRYTILEQEPSLGGSVFHYPRNKIAMTAPVDLPLVGKMKFNAVSKETLLEFWQGVVQKTGLAIRFNTRMDKVAPISGGFRVETSNGTFETGAILLAVGRRGSPRKLDVPGEELPKVVYRLIEAEQYRGQRVLVAGGGDSAVEAALACAAEPGTKVTLAYRGEAFNRVKPANRKRLEEAIAGKQFDVLLRTNVLRIHADHVDLDCAGTPVALPNDAVIVQAGGAVPTALLQDLGVTVETKYGTA